MEIDFLTERELATKLRCSVAGVRNWRRQGLPARRFGRLVRFDLERVLNWFEQRDQIGASSSQQSAKDTVRSGA